MKTTIYPEDMYENKTLLNIYIFSSVSSFHVSASVF